LRMQDRRFRGFRRCCARCNSWREFLTSGQGGGVCLNYGVKTSYESEDANVAF
jgi:hypothetical protein